LLVVQPNGENTTQGISWLLKRHGAEDIDRARDYWWQTVRTGEMQAFAGSADEFSSNERRYREGFEAALAAYGRESTNNNTAAPLPPDRTPTQDEAFECGYARGRLYYEALLRQYTKKEEESASA
jgi:hypothetical protein